MLLQQYVLRLQGEVNGIFGVITLTDRRVTDAQATDETQIKEMLRFDREKNTIGAHVPEENPSQDPSVVQYYYRPVMEKQNLYEYGFPINRDTYEIIDAFTCLGSRFGLKPLTVFVELCHSKMGSARYWANIYYVAESEIPGCIIKFDEVDVWLDNNEILDRVERDMQQDEHMQRINAEIVERKPEDVEALLDLMREELAQNGKNPEDCSTKEVQQAFSNVREQLGM